jgi:hypothetical protein
MKADDIENCEEIIKDLSNEMYPKILNMVDEYGDKVKLNLNKKESFLLKNSLLTNLAAKFLVVGLSSYKKKYRYIIFEHCVDQIKNALSEYEKNED